MPVLAHGHHRAGDGSRGEVGEDLDEDLLGQAVDVDAALAVALEVAAVGVRAVIEVAPVSVALVVGVLVLATAA